MVKGDKPITLNVSSAPAGCGAGSSSHCAAASQLASVISEVEYLMSYSAAVPTFPSSPGAVHFKVTLSPVRIKIAKSVTAAGALESPL